jgi:hypothetical protein
MWVQKDEITLITTSFGIETGSGIRERRANNNSDWGWG